MFTGGVLVKIEDGYYERADSLEKGNEIHDGLVIECVVKFTNCKSPIYGNSRDGVTEYSFVKNDPTEQRWRLASESWMNKYKSTWERPVYNFLLRTPGPICLNVGGDDFYTTPVSEYAFNQNDFSSGMIVKRYV